MCSPGLGIAPRDAGRGSNEANSKTMPAKTSSASASAAPYSNTPSELAPASDCAVNVVSE